MGIQALIYFFCTQNLKLIVWGFISQLGFTALKNKTIERLPVLRYQNNHYSVALALGLQRPTRP